MQIFKKNWLVSPEIRNGVWPILTWALENLKNLHINGLLFEQNI